MQYPAACEIGTLNTKSDQRAVTPESVETTIWKQPSHLPYHGINRMIIALMSPTTSRELRKL